MSLTTQSFPVSRRLTEKGCFKKVFAHPVYTKKTHVVSVFAGIGKNLEARLGIVVAKRNVKLAVARNRLKRIVRETFRRQSQALRGLDIVVVIKKNFTEDKLAINLPDMFKRVGEKCCKELPYSASSSTGTP